MKIIGIDPGLSGGIAILENNKVLNMFDEKFFRMYEFYLTSCEAAFKFGDQVVYQIQLSKELDTVPSTRDYIYR